MWRRWPVQCHADSAKGCAPASSWTTGRLLAAAGFPVQALVRTDIGTVSLGEQRPGSIRALRGKEIGDLYKAVGL